MTFINYLTRVHFADGVLEEALWGEMERMDCRRPLIIAEEGHLAGTPAERFFSSLPVRTRAQSHVAPPGGPTEDAARRIAHSFRALDCDLLIAFGSNRAMDLAKAVRLSITHERPIRLLSSDEGGAHLISADIPPLVSVPGILGFASAITDYTRVRLDEGRQVLLTSPHLIPNVTICDPTLTLGTNLSDTACAAAGILARAIDGYLAPTYNPPAEGMALDALTRTVLNVSKVLEGEDLDARREMMAAGLNSALALQKGLCPVHAICNAVASMSAYTIDPSALGGVMIPKLVALYEANRVARIDRVHSALGLDPAETVTEGIARLMSDLPLALTLSALGVDGRDLDKAAELAIKDRAIGNGPMALDHTQVLDMLIAAQGHPLEMRFGRA